MKKETQLWRNTDLNEFPSKKGVVLCETFGDADRVPVPIFFIEDNDSAYSLRLDLRTLGQTCGTDNIILEVANQILTVSSEKPDGKGEKKFERSFELPPLTDGTQVEAICEGGVLHIRAPKQTKRVSMNEPSLYYRLAV